MKTDVLGSSKRRYLLKANALYLGIAATGGLFSDLLGIFVGHGPIGRVIAIAPHAGIGFVEAHGLALIIGVLLWRAEPLRSWHLVATAVHALLGVSNMVFWQFFIDADMLAVGYITTSLHGLFAVLQLYAATKVTTAPTSLQHVGIHSRITY